MLYFCYPFELQLDSMFNLREPYNVISLLGQEKRSKEVGELEEDLRSQKANIEANEDKDTDLEQRFLETDSDCVAAGRPLSEFELYISTALSLEQKGIKWALRKFISHSRSYPTLWNSNGVSFPTFESNGIVPQSCVMNASVSFMLSSFSKWGNYAFVNTKGRRQMKKFPLLQACSSAGGKVAHFENDTASEK